MASKADAFKYAEQRSGAKKTAAVKRDWPAHAGGAGAADERLRHGRTASRNFSLHAEREAPYELENSSAGKPSRRSTRRSANRLKPSHPQRMAKEGLDARRRTISRAR